MVISLEVLLKELYTHHLREYRRNKLLNMSIVVKKSHGQCLFSFDGIDESRMGKARLTEFFQSLIEISEYVVCSCERPLWNESVEALVKSNHSAISQLQDVRYDDFELSFSYSKDYNQEVIISLLSKCFYFFEHPTFIFLRSKSDAMGCKKFCGENYDWGGIVDNFKCCFVFKSVEEDVVWYKTSSDIHV